MSRHVSPDRRPQPSAVPLERPADPAMQWIERSIGDRERRQVSVLACLIPMPPHAHRSVDPEEIAEVLLRHCTAISEIVSRYGGTLIRSESDRHLACWGWPIPCDDDTRPAVAAAQEIVGSLGGGAKCGVETGFAVTRQPANGETLIGIVGEVVSRAKDLQRTAPRGAVMVSSTVRRLVADAFDLSRYEVLSADTAENRECWLVLRDSYVARRYRLPAPVPLVRRDAELAALTECWERVEDGAFCAVHLRGPAGVGKSALVAEIRRLMHDRGGTLIETRCLPELQQVHLAPVRDIIGALRDCNGRPEHDVPPVGADMERPLESEQSLLELRRLVDRIASGDPLAIVVEDVHWADQATRNLLSELAADGSRGCPFLLLVTSRAEPPPSTLGAAPWRIVEVAPLSSASLDRMLQRSRVGRRLNPDKRRLIAEHADGIPLYAWELARLCAETTEREAHNRLLAQPNRLNAALAGRLDALATLKPLAQAGAVLGREFDCRLLAMVLGISVRILIERLRMLVGLGILSRPSARFEHRYRFVHAMMWSAAYGSVTKSRRRQLHARAAAEMIVSFPELAAAEPERVAHHYDKAADYENAFKWWHQAALRVAIGSSPATVISHVNRALAARSLAPDACSPLQEAELLGLLGAQVSTLRGSASAETVAVYVRALQLISELPSRPADLGFDIGWGLTAIHLVAGHTAEALASSTRLVEMARELGRDDALLAALRMNGTARVLSGLLAEGIDCLNDVVAMYDRRRHRQLCHRYVSDPCATALAHLANAHALAGNLAASLSAQLRALDLAASLRHNHTSANVLGVLATAAMHRDDLGSASALAHACHAVCVEHGYAYWQARAMLVLAWLTGNHSPEAGMPIIEAAAQRYHDTGSGRATMLADCLFSDIAIRAGQPARALQALSPSTPGKQGERLYTPEILRLEALAQVALDPSNTAACLLRLQAAEALAGEHGSQLFADRAAAGRALIAGNDHSRRNRT